MANNINWGQGASTNSIGWGQGASNNNIGWGVSQYLTISVETNIYGKINLLNDFINSFQSRVESDGGILYDYNCLFNQLLGNISNGYLLAIPFSNRVATDSGIYESETCLINFLNNL